MAYFKWTDEYKTLVKKLYEEGMDTRQVYRLIFMIITAWMLVVGQFNDTEKGATHIPVKETKIKDVQRGTEIVLNKDGSQSSSTTLQMTSEQAKDLISFWRAHGLIHVNGILCSAL